MGFLSRIKGLFTADTSTIIKDTPNVQGKTKEDNVSVKNTAERTQKVSNATTSNMFTQSDPKKVIKPRKKYDAKDYEGKRFGRLVALHYVRTVKGKKMWLCRCDCGVEKEIASCSLLSGGTMSCGCLRRGSKKRYRNQQLISAHAELTSNESDYTEISNDALFDKSSSIYNPLIVSDDSGITWLEATRKWYATIMYKGNIYNLGKFSKQSDAQNIRVSAQGYMTENKFIEWYAFYEKVTDGVKVC